MLMPMDMVPPIGDVVTACRERGLLVLTAGDNMMRLAPPLIVSEAEVNRAVGIVGDALGALAR